MTYDEINAIAYDEARRHFVAMIKSGVSLEAATMKREEVYDFSRRATCTHCKVEKHVSQFHTRGEKPQAWCKECQTDRARENNTSDRHKWRELLA